MRGLTNPRRIMRGEQHLINQHNASLHNNLLAVWAARAHTGACEGIETVLLGEFWYLHCCSLESKSDYFKENTSIESVPSYKFELPHPNLVYLLPLATPLLFFALNSLIVNVPLPPPHTPLFLFSFPHVLPLAAALSPATLSACALPACCSSAALLLAGC
jgi:hypothetical protein